MADHAVVSGSSTHADRLATIRLVHDRTGRVIDPHTADGVKVALQHTVPGTPTLCLETALPAKFGETIVEALGCEPSRPPSAIGLEDLPTRVTVVENDLEQVKDFIVHVLSR